VINEVDADMTGTDADEFIELYDGGVGGTSLTGLVVVLYNGASDVSYDAFDLDGHSTNSSGYFVLASVAVIASSGCTVGVDCLSIGLTNAIQNGPDAVALYTGDATDFPNGTAVGTPSGTTLLDALVYDTSEADDPGLLTALTPGHPQINEDTGGDAATNANKRQYDGLGGPFVTEAYVQGTPTPLAAN
jgi:hypothetical protein